MQFTFIIVFQYTPDVWYSYYKDAWPYDMNWILKSYPAVL